MEIETRSDVIHGKYSGINFFSSIKDAYQACAEDKNIWKISWEGHRYVTKLKKEKWNPLSEEILNQMSDEYRNASEDTRFWVDQLVIPKNFKSYLQMMATMGKEEFDNLINSKCIVEILTDQQFRDKYCV